MSPHPLGLLTKRWIAALVAVPLAAAGLTAAFTATSAYAEASGGNGASLPYIEMQAENATTNGTVVGPSFTQGKLADEASHRKAVTLSGQGKYVEFTTTAPTNSIDFRYSIPDTGDGSVYTAPLSLYIDGQKQADFSLTNAYSWYYGSYPFTNTPGSNQHHFYDETHRLFSKTYPAGTTFKLQVDSEDTADSYTIDFADFEQVGPALSQPAGSVSVTSKGADATGKTDATAAFNAAIAAAGPGGTVWIPKGTFKIPGHIKVNDVTVTGAGMWYSTVKGAAPGFYGDSAPQPSTDVHLSNFAIFGNVQERCDSCQVNGIGGAMSDSTVSDIWIDHLKVGAWMDGPMDNLTFSGMRIRDTTADGINFHGGVTNSTVTDSDIRNTGDDGIATWADSSLGADAHDTISDNSVSLQTLANGIAIYGGHDNTVSGNRVVDTGLTQGGGIHVGQRFTSTPVGATTIENNTMIRDGSLDPNWKFGVGALWFDGSQGAITGPINVTNALIEQSPFEAVQWVEGTISGVSLKNVTIAGTGTYAMQEQTGGSATFTNVVATGVAQNPPSYSCEGDNFTVTDGGGNSGIAPTTCGGTWPDPVFPPYPVTGVTASPGALDFGSVTDGTTSDAQTVTVSNPTDTAAAVSSVSVTGDFAQTNTCATSIPANGSCSVDVTFTPTKAGDRSGTLTVSAGGSTSTVSLSGTGTKAGPAVNATPASLSFPTTLVGSTSEAATTKLTNSGTAAASISSISASGDFAQTNDCGSSLAVGASCTIDATFTPTTGGARHGKVTVHSNAVNAPTTISLSGDAIGSTTNVALNKPTSASGSVNGVQSPDQAVDGDASTYWESTDGAFPQWWQVDLGQKTSIGKVVVSLPPSPAWEPRTQTFSVLGSTDGSDFSTLVESADYTFDPNVNDNSATITFPAANVRYLRLKFTANTGWPAGQASEVEVYPSTSGSTGGGGDSTSLSASPTSLSFGSQDVGTSSHARSVTLTNNGAAAAGVSSITASGDFAQTNTCGNSVAAGTTCRIDTVFTPTKKGTRTGTLTVTSDAADSPITVALSGTGTAAGDVDLALGKTMTASGHAQNYIPGNAADGDAGSYWESTDNAFPQWLQVDLGAKTDVSRIVLKLPPSPAWGPRTQTLSVLGSTDGSDFSTVAGSTGFTFDPTINDNTVTIDLTAEARYLRLKFTGNTGWPAGQVSEFEVYGSTNNGGTGGDGGDTQAPSAPSHLAYSTSGDDVHLTWDAASDDTGVTAYDIYANDALLATVNGSTLSYTDKGEAASATVSYYVKARDAAGNVSPASNTVTRTGTGTGTGGTDQAAGKPITVSSHVDDFVGSNADDGDVTTYWEGSGFPSSLAVDMGANVDAHEVVVKLNPDAAWGTRTQKIKILGHDQDSSTFTTIKAAANYTFAQGDNVVKIPVAATVSAVKLVFTANSGAGGGQVAELQVIGVPGANPDLTVTSVTSTPAAPDETDPITLKAKVKNIGSKASPATTVNFYLGKKKIGTAPVGALAAGESSTVSADIGAQEHDTYKVTAKVDEANTVIEQNESNNSYTDPDPLVVSQVQSSDLVPTAVTWTPSNPTDGDTVTFSAAIKNQGIMASASGSHKVTLKVTDASSGSTVATLTGSSSGSIAAGDTTDPITLGSWTAVDGNYDVDVSVAVDGNEVSVKRSNNSSTTPLFAGLGANMPYDMYEAEDGQVGGGATVLSPNRTIGDLAGEASGRQAVTLDTTGAYVKWTTHADTNTLVTRYSIPDAPGGGGQTATLDVYVNGKLLKPITLTSHFDWLYGAETSPTNSPSAGPARHIYDESHIMLGETVPAGSVIKLQKDSSNSSKYAIDFMQTEEVSPIANPDPAHYIVPKGTSQSDVQSAIQKAESTSGAVGVYLPAGTYPTASKFQVGGKALKIVGAGPWYTQFETPQSRQNTDAGFSVQPTADGSTFSGFAFFGNYTKRIDGPGKVFNLTNVSDMTIDNIWVEHTIVAVWGTHVKNSTFENMRIRDTYADGINLTNGSSGNVIKNDEARATGDDSFALFAAQDLNSGDLTDNTIENVTALFPWRAAGIAVYGGEDNTVKNFRVADTLTYSGLTVSSLNFGYPFQGFGKKPTTITDFSLERDGGHFWGDQVFGAIWMFSATQPFQGIRISDGVITDPTYSGIMFQTDYVGGVAQNPVTDTVFTNMTITGAHQSGDKYNDKSGYGIWANPMPEPGQGPAVGSVTFNGLTESDNHVDIKNTTSTFTIHVNN